MREKRPFVGLCLIAGALLSCQREKPLPPADAESTSASTPASTLRPLTSRDRSGPAASAAPAADSSLPPGHPPIDAAPPAGAAADTGSIAGTIAVAPSLQSRASGGVLFVIARSGADRRIVAVRREDNVTFPFKFGISGRDAMIAGTTFAGPLEVTARLSKSGDAVAAKGDLEGTARGVAVGATDVKVTLDTVHE
jgi:cytochrome c-type biogenesis protein CcmH